MKSLFGVVNHNVEHVKVLLDVLKKDYDIRCQVLGFGDKPKRKANVVLVPSASLLLKHHDRLSKMSSASVFVFDNPIMCKTIKPLKLLDVALEKPGFKYTFKPIKKPDLEEAIQEDRKVVLDTEVMNVIPTLLTKTIPSTLNEIMTFLYSVKSDKRYAASKYMYLWMVKKKSVSALESKIVKVLGMEKTPKAFKRLSVYLKSPKFKKIKPAFAEAYAAKQDGKQGRIPAIAKEYGVDPYDLRYVVHNLDKLKKPKYKNLDTNKLYKRHLKNRDSKRKFKESE